MDDEFTGQRSMGIVTSIDSQELSFICTHDGYLIGGIFWDEILDFEIDRFGLSIEVSWRTDDSQIRTEKWGVTDSYRDTFTSDAAPLLRAVAVADKLVARTDAYQKGYVTVTFDTRGLRETLEGVADWKCGLP